MKSIDVMVNDVLRREGGDTFTDDPDDLGGATKYGITQKTLSAYLGRVALKSEVQSLSEDVARDIYERNYYFAPRIDRLPETIQPFIFDCAVNHGTRRAIKFVQSVCNEAGSDPQLSVDGAMGPNTLRSAEWAQEEMGKTFLKALIQERRNFYNLIVAARPEQNKYLKGWMHRVDEFEKGVA